MPKRRYTRYTLEDTQRALQQQQHQLHIRILPGSASLNGRRIRLYTERYKREVWAILLARTSEWYAFNLNTYSHGIEVVIAGTHDSCVSVPVLAMDSLEWSDPYQIRYESTFKASKDPGSWERFNRLRKSRYGHNILIGSLIVGRVDARDGLMTLPERTRFRIEAEVKHLRHRRPGRPLKLWEESEAPQH